jgi:FlaA1/EpsC-like NDP-sugar epimerase
MYKDKVILITGGTGSWGHELTKQLLEKNPKKIIIFSRGELMQVTMQRKFNDARIAFIIGDIRDAEAVEQLFVGREIDFVFHLAALKHVPVCEDQPQEAIKTNITGTVNLINSSIRHKVKQFIDVSSDKAVNPSCFYGLTKQMGEKLTIQANDISDTVFLCVRGGNVLGSNGSVIPHFIKQIKTMNRVTVTDMGMTRFFLSLPEAIHLLFEAAEQSKGGEIYVMNMPSFYIKDLALVLIEHYGDADTTIAEVGIRKGEKLHEELFAQSENAKVLNDNYFVISSGNSKTGAISSSANNIRDRDYLKQILQKGEFI